MGKKIEGIVEIQPIATRRIIISLCGVSPLIMHRFARKAWQELLYPSGRKNAAERASSLKHDPLEEYRGCFYKNRDDNTPTLFHLPNGMPHKSIAAAALDMPGVSRTAMERWTSIVDVNVHLFGVPQLFMAMVRNSDMSRTPDVRTRPIFNRWACTFEIAYKVQPLNDHAVLNLLAAAGFLVGFGDWRPQKGGPFGKFRICQPHDAEFKDIVKREGRKAQVSAYEIPSYHDEDTQELMTWFLQEVSRRRQDDDEGEIVPGVAVQNEDDEGSVMPASTKPNGKHAEA